MFFIVDLQWKVYHCYGLTHILQTDRNRRRSVKIDWR